MSDSSDFSVVDALARLASGESLDETQAESVMRGILTGDTTPAQIGALLMGLRIRGETVDEVTGLVRAMRAASVKISPDREGLVDLCGTGGDGSGSFNISTAAALIVAACGVPVAKHGNRSASSLCGSADVLEALGVPIELEASRVEKSIEELGFGFLFARTYHPAMRHVAGPRGELKMRTVFNMLGPMTNPAGVKRQLIGVFDGAIAPLMTGVLDRLGSEKVWVVHGEGGLDEVSISGTTQVTALESGKQRSFEIHPRDAGLEAQDESGLAGGDAGRNAEIMTALLDGEKGTCRDASVLNASATLVVQGLCSSLEEAARVCAEAIDSGKAKQLLSALRDFR